MKRTLALLAVLALLVGTLGAEPKQRTLSVTQTSDTWSLPGNTRHVAVISAAGSDTCRFRLFTNRDTPAAATMADPSIEIVAGAVWTFDINRSSTDVGGDTEAGASGYVAISAVCASSDTATLQVVYK